MESLCALDASSDIFYNENVPRSRDEKGGLTDETIGG
jgi:hypothetical protein